MVETKEEDTKPRRVRWTPNRKKIAAIWRNIFRRGAKENRRDELVAKKKGQK